MKIAAWAMAAALVRILALLPGVASAGGGWYLLRPPVELRQMGSRKYWMPVEGPVTRQWEQLSAFDSAADCERARDVWQEASKRQVETYKPPPAAETDGLEERAAMVHLVIAYQAQCVASDDPRLAQNEPRPPVQPLPAPPVQSEPATPAFKAAVTACRSIVRQETNRQFAEINSLNARLGIGMIESKFDAYVTPDGQVSYLGTQAENFSFAKCLNDGGYPIDQR